MEIYVYGDGIILNDTSADENPVGVSEKKLKTIVFTN